MRNFYFAVIFNVILFFSAQASGTEYTYKLWSVSVNIYEGYGALYTFSVLRPPDNPPPYFNCWTSDALGWFAAVETHPLDAESRAIDYYGLALGALSRNAEVTFDLGECLTIPDLGVSVMIVEGISIIDEG
ncbi:hypothetical protein K8B33_12860 [Alcanivorax sp. JB21]|uniref:hypothetical protein n=1 Tax=Alcanivorax limicola TaxID=2874102 RepID=UPI001CBFF66C|nr:hypothetical protein [Alcanivorax limicola]MBZ2189991.1 hypothetical protein [Alcanivorax limicola]